MLISAVEAGRAQAKQVALIALDNPPASLCTPSAVTSCIDMFSAANMTMTQLQQELAATLQRAGPHTTCVVLDSLPALCFDAAHLTTMLADLCNHPHVSSVLAHVHKVRMMIATRSDVCVVRRCNTWGPSIHRICWMHPTCNTCCDCAAAGWSSPPARQLSSGGLLCRDSLCMAQPQHGTSALLVRCCSTIHIP